MSGGGTGEHDEHIGKNGSNSNQIYQIQHLTFLVYNHLFYRREMRERNDQT